MTAASTVSGKTCPTPAARMRSDGARQGEGLQVSALGELERREVTGQAQGDIVVWDDHLPCPRQPLAIFLPPALDFNLLPGHCRAILLQATVALRRLRLAAVT